MGFNYGLEKKNFDSQWDVIRKQYENAGMSSEAIQAMYDYDWSVFNANRSYQNHTQEIAAPSFEQSEESYSPLMNKYQEAISVTDHYCETNSRFAWIGKIENERLLSALESLSELDLKILTLYVYAGYTESEIASALESKRITIHKRIERMTMLLKNF
ncbi:sigma factor-like helix-turn-helix DNA-binding protein [Faecalibacterium prausnitzii]|uniref:sigma factor-like helix-turn-helix DNA-binding protein n=1 Tax=Faecalibacterium prausnitzii TaxID=853 RepID=UPI001F3122DA|nr:sigma factor-like helix-turn-helix DNA-binding protein [Faecalibacterium prausnitzii]